MKKLLIALLILALLLVGCTNFASPPTNGNPIGEAGANPDSIPTPPTDEGNPDEAPPNLPF